MSLKETIERLIYDAECATLYLQDDAYYDAEELVEDIYKRIDNLTVENKVIAGMLSKAKEQLFTALQLIRVRSKMSACVLLEDVVETLRDIEIILK